MLINKSSWHYRLLDSTHTYPMPTSLCSYFWTVVGKILSLGIAFVLMGVLIAGLPVLAWSVFVNHSRSAMLPLGVMVLFPTLILLGIGIMFLHEKATNSLTKSPNLFFEFIRATKNKVCPLITYEGDE